MKSLTRLQRMVYPSLVVAFCGLGPSPLLAQTPSDQPRDETEETEGGTRAKPETTSARDDLRPDWVREGTSEQGPKKSSWMFPYALTVLAIVLALVVICRPGNRTREVRIIED